MLCSTFGFPTSRTRGPGRNKRSQDLTLSAGSSSYISDPAPAPRTRSALLPLIRLHPPGTVRPFSDSAPLTLLLLPAPAPLPRLRPCSILPVLSVLPLSPSPTPRDYDSRPVPGSLTIESRSCGEQSSQDPVENDRVKILWDSIVLHDFEEQSSLDPVKNNRVKILWDSIVLHDFEERSSQDPVENDRVKILWRTIESRSCGTRSFSTTLKNDRGSDLPFYMLNLDDVYERHLQWQTLLPRVKPFYAVKCNPTAEVLRTLVALGTGFDCASKREIEKVLSLGVTPDRIIYANTTKPQSHIRYGSAAGVDMMTFDCEEELLKISTSHSKAKLVLRISVDDSKSLAKLNVKFGAKLHVVGDLLKRAQELHLNVIGVSFHVGSLCPDSEPYKMAITDARLVFDQASRLGFHMRLLDIGGGFTGNEKFPKMAQKINEVLDELFPLDSEVQIIAEPGRFFVESAFTLAMNVISKKYDTTDSAETKSTKVMIYFVNDGIHGSFGIYVLFPESKEHISLDLHRPVEPTEPKYKSVIWGPTCNSVDVVTSLWMPELHVGDWLLARWLGAYSLSLSSDFNGFEKAQIYPVYFDVVPDLFLQTVAILPVDKMSSNEDLTLITAGVM
ncbi:antizyme inhibitor 2-like [Periophthalmus magnuspinnatus]|uniref:antizyme inhibitor 2-like n=1 Tax=Periophthalmus magnuspinnatus TaxID=409849 RepID=UPI00243663F5|nr:antizyme inhibitor 2-like [Periophthalmus magnuspinnatus]